jgi:Zn-dependent protease
VTEASKTEPPRRQKPSGTLRIAQFRGIDVYVHWSWAIVAVIQIQLRENESYSYAWSALEYISLFAIVLLHEFGHAFACRSVGGKAEQIVLWPLGGVAYVAPPQRPGAMLWSIVAGPLVNVALVPVLFVAMMLAGGPNDEGLGKFFFRLSFINAGLFVFNMLPIYPLDGGQILRSLLWYAVGRARSLIAATIVGFFGAGAMAIAAVYFRSIWIGILAFFNFQRASSGYSYAKALRAVEVAPRHQHVNCPNCNEPPPVLAITACVCGNAFDPFATDFTCPHCSRQFLNTVCAYCAVSAKRDAWLSG